jgi:hypothetical protein
LQTIVSTTSGLVTSCLCNGIILACQDKLEKKLEGTFEINDVGPMTEFVVCLIDHDQSKSTMKFLQPSLLQSFADKFELPARVTGGTPTLPEVLLCAYKDEKQLSVTQQCEFRKAIGKLHCLARMLQHDMLHAVWDMLRFSSSAWTTTWKAVLQTMKYCVKTKNRGLVFTQECMWTGKDFEYDLIGYSDLNYATDHNSRQLSCHAKYTWRNVVFEQRANSWPLLHCLLLRLNLWQLLNVHRI